MKVILAKKKKTKVKDQRSQRR